MLGGLFQKFKAALSKTKEVFTSPIRALVQQFRAIDPTALERIREILLGADFGPEPSDRVVEDLRKAYKMGRVKTMDDVLPFLKQELKQLLKQGSSDLCWAPQPPTVILVVGVNGTGKTTSIAKLAKMFAGQKKKVIIGAADTFRAAAIDQLSIWAERAGAEIVKHQQGADPAAVCFDACEAALARRADVLIVDTAGRQQTKENLMQELGKIRRVLEKKITSAPHETLLVLDATTGQNALSQAQHFTAVASLTGLILTKLDGTAKGGVIFGIKSRFQVPVKFVGLGESLDDLAPFDPDAFVDGLIES